MGSNCFSSWSLHIFNLIIKLYFDIILCFALFVLARLQMKESISYIHTACGRSDITFNMSNRIHIYQIYFKTNQALPIVFFYFQCKWYKVHTHVTLLTGIHVLTSIGRY